ncbi:MAG: restriction endonuclease subunit S [Candidatus Pacearchaeota archaeon]
MKTKEKLKQTEIGEIPEDWEEMKLNEATDTIFSGGTPNTRIASYWDGEIRWLSSGETGQTFIRDTIKKITPEGVKNSSTRLAKKGDVVVASAGQGYTRGQTAYCMIDTHINQSVISLRANPKILDSGYLFYNLVSRYLELRNVSDANSSRGSLTTKIIGDLKIEFPPLPEQKAIAKILSDLDNKIELNQKMNKTLEAIGQALFKHWFIDFQFPNEEGKPYKSSGGEMIESELGVIPKGWSVDKAIKLFKLEYGWHLPEWNRKEGNIPVYGSGGLSGYHDESFIKKAGLIIGRAGKIGSDSVYYSHKEFCPLETTYYVSIENQNLVRYLYYFIKTMSMVNTGSSVPNLSRNSIHDHEILIPENKIIKKFDSLVERLFNLKYQNEEEIKSLSQLRDSLLPKLMSRKIRVPIK